MRRRRAQQWSAFAASVIISVGVGVATNQLLNEGSISWTWLVGFLGLAAVVGSAQLLLERVVRVGFSRVLPQRQVYLASLRRSLRYLDLKGLPVPSARTPSMQEVFVAPELVPAQAEGPVATTEDLRMWLGTTGTRAMVVLGGPGSGKTTLLHHLAVQFASPWTLMGRLPVLLTLHRHVAAIVADSLDLAETAVRTPWHDDRIPVEWMRRRLKSGDCLILLDGLDEIPRPHERAEVVGWLRRQMDAHPGNAWIVTSRPFDDANDLLPGAVVRRLRGFSPEQTRAFLRKWHQAYDSEAPESFTTDLLERIDGFRLGSLASTPLLLVMIANVHLYRGAPPSSAAALYADLVEVLLFRRNEAKGLVDPFNPRQMSLIMRTVAAEMMEEERGELATDEMATAVRRAMDQFRSDATATPEDLLRTACHQGVMVQGGDGSYAFTFRGLQEYLAAEWFRGRRGAGGLLTRHIENPWWHETILLWAAMDDATIIIEACLDAGTDRALDLAVECAGVALEIRPELRDALERETSRRAFASTAEPLTSTGEISRPSPRDLLLFVTDLYAKLARELTETPGGHDRDPSRDLELALARVRDDEDADPEANAAAYLSAAVLAAECGRGEDVRRYRALGLISLAVAMRERSRESAQDLCLAALRVLGSREPDPEILCRAVLTYLGERHVPDVETEPVSERIMRALRRSPRAHDPTLFDLVMPLLVENEIVHEWVLRSLAEDADLASKIAYRLGLSGAGPSLPAALSAEVEQRRRERRRLVYGLGVLARLELSQDSLTVARGHLADYGARAPESLLRDLDQIVKALDALHVYLTQRSFDERDDALRTAERIAAAASAGVREAPTALAVELVTPAAERIEALARKARVRLAESCPPRPEVSLALEHARLADEVVTVQVRVANAEGSAPMESGRLTVRPDADLYVPIGAPIDLPGPVRGGDARTELVRLRMKDDRPDFELSLSLQYRPRYTSEDVRHDGRLPVRVAHPEDFEQIPNPYREGASGRPVQDPAMFFGRDELIDGVRAKLRAADSPGVGVAVFGQKRTGKSSIRLHLMRRLRDEDGFPVVDVGNIGTLTPGGAETTDRRLLAALLWRILQYADRTVDPGHGPRLLPEDFTRDALLDSPDPVHDCAELFDAYRAAIPGRLPFVVFIDEFQYLDHWIREGLVPATLMQSFKAIVERGLFHLVIVGQSQLDRLMRAEPNVFGVFVPVRVTYLADDDASGLVQVPIPLPGAAGPSRFRGRAVAEILRLTGGNPFYVQRFCYELVEYMNREQAALVTEADVEEVSRELLPRLEAANFDNLESPGHLDDGFTAADFRAVLVAVARATREGASTVRDIERHYDGPALRELLNDLVSRQVVDHQAGSHRIAVGIYEDWLMRYFGAQGDTGAA